MLTFFKIAGAAALVVLAILDLSDWQPFANRASNTLASSGTRTSGTGLGTSGTSRHK